ncbi:hypothetical protein H5410_051750 [Solanum commersonii]|uniref:Uncharacterized protein n=1 Tax=Solanum commersonii TaxID=4109 RepID=A0A9J5WZA6_SOLCO|nr:hypothetical protein H5410_051750 [Solanum commersonii]
MAGSRKNFFRGMGGPGHFSRTIAKGPDTTTWIRNLHADAHDFDSHIGDLEEISRKVFSAHLVNSPSSFFGRRHVFPRCSLF